MSGLAGLCNGTRVPICPDTFCVPWDRDRDRSLRDERDRDKFSRDCPAGLSRGTSGTGTKIRGTVPSRPLPIPGRKRSKVDASIFDSALSHTRRSDASEKREENSVSTFGRFRLWTSFESSPVSVKSKKIVVQMHNMILRSK